MNIFVQMLILVVAFAGFLSKPFITVYSPQAGSQTVKGYETYTYDAVLESTVSMKINSSFDQKEIRITESIPFETEYIDDPEREYGLEETIEEGILGNTTYIYEVAYWHDEEISRTLIDTQVEEPKNEVISVGKKVIWREIDTEYGELKYWRKIHVWATKYDGNCEGCRGLTYSGTLVRKCVCAVDPKVISLGTNF